MLPSERPYLCRLGIHLPQRRRTDRGSVVETCARCDFLAEVIAEATHRGVYVPAFRTALELAEDPVARLEQLENEVRDLREYTRRLELRLWAFLPHGH